MIDSIEQLTLKTGQEVIIMSHRDISDELEVLEGLLEAPRLNRDKVKTSTENIRKIIDETF